MNLLVTICDLNLVGIGKKFGLIIKGWLGWVKGSLKFKVSILYIVLNKLFEGFEVFTVSVVDFVGYLLTFV